MPWLISVSLDLYSLYRNVMRLSISTILSASILLLLSPAFAATALPPDPIYIRVDNGWKGFYAKNDQFVEYLLSGSEVKLQDPYHILLAPRVGLFVDYVSKNEFAGGDSNLDRKSTRLNSSHSQISYAVFCLKKKKKDTVDIITVSNVVVNSNLWESRVFMKVRTSVLARRSDDLSIYDTLAATRLAQQSSLF